MRKMYSKNQVGEIAVDEVKSAISSGDIEVLPDTSEASAGNVLALNSDKVAEWKAISGGTQWYKHTFPLTYSSGGGVKKLIVYSTRSTKYQGASSSSEYSTMISDNALFDFEFVSGNSSAVMPKVIWFQFTYSYGISAGKICVCTTNPNATENFISIVNLTPTGSAPLFANETVEAI